MITLDASLTGWTAADLLAAVKRLAAQGREVTADLIALLAEVDSRKLYQAEDCTSLFEYCVVRLGLSEQQAYHRIQAARAARRFPVTLERLRDGSVTLTNLALLRPHLTEENHERLLGWATGRAKREVEVFMRGLSPLPEVGPSIRKLPPPRTAATASPPAAEGGPKSGAPPSTEGPAGLGHRPTERVPRPSLAAAGSEAAAPRVPDEERALAAMPASPPWPGAVQASGATPPPQRAEIRPLAPTRYSLHVTISVETHDKLRRAQDLLRHTIPTGDPSVILDRALTLLVAQLERAKCGAKTPRATAVAPSASRRHRPRRRPAAAPAPPVPPVAGPPAAADGELAAVVTPTPPAAVAAAAPPVPRQAVTLPTSRSRSRYIPAAVRRVVWDRDEGRCRFTGPSGRCSQTGRLEFHHRVPFAEGGAPTVENLYLACTFHNGQEAARWFGDDAPSYRGRARAAGPVHHADNSDQSE